MKYQVPLIGLLSLLLASCAGFRVDRTPVAVTLSDGTQVVQMKEMKRGYVYAKTAKAGDIQWDTKDGAFSSKFKMGTVSGEGVDWPAVVMRGMELGQQAGLAMASGGVVRPTTTPTTGEVLTVPGVIPTTPAGDGYWAWTGPANDNGSRVACFTFWNGTTNCFLTETNSQLGRAITRIK